MVAHNLATRSDGINQNLVRLLALNLDYGKRTVAFSNLRREITRIASELPAETVFHDLYEIPFGNSPTESVAEIIVTVAQDLPRNTTSNESVAERLREFYSNLVSAIEKGNPSQVILMI